MEKDEFIKHLEDIRIANERSYDRILLSLSSGGIVVSLVVLGELESRGEPILHAWSLALALILLLFTIIAATLNFHIGAVAASQELKTRIDENYTPKLDVRKCPRKINLATGLVWLIGLASLGFFIWCNLNQHVQ